MMNNLRIDTQEIDFTLENYIARTEAIKKFINTRKEKLISLTGELKNFISLTEAEGLEIGDMYSDGEGSRQYLDSGYLVANCVLTFKKKLVQGGVSRDDISVWLQELWNDTLDGRITASFTTWQVEENRVKFKIFI